MEQRNVLPFWTAGHGRLTGEAIARRLAVPRPPRPGFSAPAGDERAPTPAAVLVPIVDRAEGMTVLLTRRTLHLAHHPGQVSFPGGRLEPGDRGDAVACALRETVEETGLAPQHVRILGRMPDRLTGTGFVVSPVVGLVTPPFTLAPDPFEVAEVFEVPLDFLLDPDNHTLHQPELSGRPRPFWAMTWGDTLIWGATAGILVELSGVLGDEPG
jgi:8-oxo-dGTP pyrophosphatase MutT (NUDIX family)